jgi:hypothetical protein
VYVYDPLYFAIGIFGGLAAIVFVLATALHAYNSLCKWFAMTESSLRERSNRGAERRKPA